MKKIIHILITAMGLLLNACNYPFEDILLVTVETGNVDNIFLRTANITGTVAGLKEVGRPVEIGFCYGTTEALTVESGTCVKVEEATNGTCSTTLNDLQPGTTYYYCTYSIVDGEVHYGALNSFTTMKFVGGKVGEPVDLGLSVKWANWNVGASGETEYGGLYGWGDPTGLKTTTNTGSYPAISDISGTVYDIAHVQWGEDWRIPTVAERQELLDKCTYELTTQNGVFGRKVIGPNGNSIFLPAAGIRAGISTYLTDESGNYWSSTLYPISSSTPTCFYSQIGKSYDGAVDVSTGMSIRPVQGAPSLPYYIQTRSATPEYTSAILEGQFMDMKIEGGSYQFGFYYNTTGNPSADNAKFIAGSDYNRVSFTASLNDLNVGETYYYCACVIANGKYYYSNVRKFTTKSEGNPIDLGLSVKWAKYNYGASVESEKGIVQSFTSDPSSWRGWDSSWRIPTKSEMQELIDNCVITQTSIDGVEGYKFTSLNNNNSIFLPTVSDGYWISDYTTNSTYHKTYWDAATGWHNAYTDYSATSWYLSMDSSIEILFVYKNSISNTSAYIKALEFDRCIRAVRK